LTKRLYSHSDGLCWQNTLLCGAILKNSSHSHCACVCAHACNSCISVPLLCVSMWRKAHLRRRERFRKVRTEPKSTRRVRSSISSILPRLRSTKSCIVSSAKNLCQKAGVLTCENTMFVHACVSRPVHGCVYEFQACTHVISVHKQSHRAGDNVHHRRRLCALCVSGRCSVYMCVIFLMQHLSYPRAKNPPIYVFQSTHSSTRPVFVLFFFLLSGASPVPAPSTWRRSIPALGHTA